MLRSGTCAKSTHVTIKEHAPKSTHIRYYDREHAPKSTHVTIENMRQINACYDREHASKINACYDREHAPNQRVLHAPKSTVLQSRTCVKINACYGREHAPNQRVLHASKSMVLQSRTCVKINACYGREHASKSMRVTVENMRQNQCVLKF